VGAVRQYLHRTFVSEPQHTKCTPGRARVDFRTFLLGGGFGALEGRVFHLVVVGLLLRETTEITSSTFLRKKRRGGARGVRDGAVGVKV